MRRRPTGVAMRRRAAAAGVDGMCVLVVFAAGMWWVWRAEDAWWERALGDSERVRRWSRRAAWGTKAVAVVLRNVPTPGQRIAGIRRIDARTGGPVSGRSAVILQLAAAGRQQINGRLIRLLRMGRFDAPSHEAGRPAQAAEDSEPAGLAGGEPAEATPAESLAPVGNCLIPLLVVGAAEWLRARAFRRSPRRQTPDERLAGVVVVSTRR